MEGKGEILEIRGGKRSSFARIGYQDRNAAIEDGI